MKIACPRLGTCLVIESRGEAKGALNHFEPGSLFAEDDAFALGHGEILTRLFVGPQSCPVFLIGSKRVEGNESPSDIVGSFEGQEVTQQMTATSRNDARPILGVLLQFITLGRIDLVTDKTGNRHYSPPRVRFGPPLRPRGQQYEHRRNQQHCLPAADRVVKGSVGSSFIAQQYARR